MLNKKSVDDINVKGKKVLVRCDFNVPMNNGKIEDDTRIVASLRTIKYALRNNAKVIFSEEVYNNLCSLMDDTKNRNM